MLKKGLAILIATICLCIQMPLCAENKNLVVLFRLNELDKKLTNYVGQLAQENNNDEGIIKISFSDLERPGSFIVSSGFDLRGKKILTFINYLEQAAIDDVQKKQESEQCLDAICEAIYLQFNHELGFINFQDLEDRTIVDGNGTEMIRTPKQLERERKARIVKLRESASELYESNVLRPLFVKTCIELFLIKMASGNVEVKRDGIAQILLHMRSKMLAIANKEKLLGGVITKEEMNDFVEKMTSSTFIRARKPFPWKTFTKSILAFVAIGGAGYCVYKFKFANEENRWQLDDLRTWMKKTFRAAGEGLREGVFGAPEGDEDVKSSNESVSESSDVGAAGVNRKESKKDAYKELATTVNTMLKSEKQGDWGALAAAITTMMNSKDKGEWTKLAGTINDLLSNTDAAGKASININISGLPELVRLIQVNLPTIQQVAQDLHATRESIDAFRMSRVGKFAGLGGQASQRENPEELASAAAQAEPGHTARTCAIQ